MFSDRRLSRYKIETAIYSKIGMNSRKAMADKMNRTKPVVLLRAKVISSDAAIIKPIAMNEAHILSNDDIPSDPILHRIMIILVLYTISKR